MTSRPARHSRPAEGGREEEVEEEERERGVCGGEWCKNFLPPLALSLTPLSPFPSSSTLSLLSPPCHPPPTPAGQE
jgi:hypothetical protein